GGLILGAALWSTLGRPSVLVPLAAGTLAFYVAAVLQQKGWRYHFYPALALGWVMLVVVSASANWRELVGARRLLAISAVIGAATIALTASGAALRQLASPQHSRYDADPDLGELIPFVRDRAAGGTLVVLSSNPGSAFPLVNYAGVRWGARFPHLWPIVAAYDSALKGPGAIQYRDASSESALARQVR